MVKIIIGVVLMCLAGGAWLYLDCLNEKEQGQTATLQQGMLQAKAEARKRIEIKAAFENQLQSSLKSCQDAAEKAKTGYLDLLQKTLPSKRGVVVVPQTTLDAAETMMTTAKADCQAAYDEQSKHTP